MGKRFTCNDSTVVTTAKGKLRGFLFDGIYTFHGIRYAKAKRFQAPQPVEPWEGVKDALSYGMICPVLDQPRPTGEVMTPHRFWPESEHCQYLNIWTNTLDADAKKPVLVWFHGGGFSAGSSIEQVAYDGDNLVRYGDVVVVTVNHRLNVFGFLDLSAFGEKYANSANAGIADLVASLTWVKENIAAFGGDPDNVTIFGQSGGGGKVTALGQCPEAVGLFHKAVVMSGVIADNEFGDDIDSRELGLALADACGIAEDEIEKLEKVPVDMLKRAINKVIADFRAKGKRVGWAPKANGWYLGDPCVHGFSEYYQTVPTMVGTVFGEFNLEPTHPGKEEMTAEQRRAIVEKKFGEHTDEVIAAFKKAYPDKNEILVNETDCQMFRPGTIDYIRKKTVESAAPVYSYLFSLEFDYQGGKIAWHCSDIPFWFYNAERLPICQVDGVTERLQAQMGGALVNFAKTGDPNGSGLPQWDPCTEDEMRTMILDAECEQRVNYEDELIPLLKKVTPPFIFDPALFATDDDDEEEGNAWVF